MVKTQRRKTTNQTVTKRNPMLMKTKPLTLNTNFYEIYKINKYF